MLLSLTAIIAFSSLASRMQSPFYGPDYSGSSPNRGEEKD
jgi:hypothetical protein